jgi:hypothetical protein
MQDVTKPEPPEPVTESTPHVVIVSTIGGPVYAVGPFASDGHAQGWRVMHPNLYAEALPMRFPESPTAYSTFTKPPEPVRHGLMTPRCEADWADGGVCATPLASWQSPCPNEDRHALARN